MSARFPDIVSDIQAAGGAAGAPETIRVGAPEGFDRYFMRLAYNGLPYHGWQRQPGDISVQQLLEEALAKVMRLPAVPVTGAGRTDAGVSAACMIAHFDLPSSLAVTPGKEPRILHSLNSLLGPNIVVYRIWKVRRDAHARFDAIARSYRYFAHTVRSPFTGGMSWLAPAGLDFHAMNRAAELLLDTDDFTSFAKLHSDARTNICHVTHAAWRPQDASEWECPQSEASDCVADGCEAADCIAGNRRRPTMWVFEITADRFLRNMVRAVVGTLVEVGRGKLSLDSFREVIEKRDRCAAGTSMPAGPLFLHDVTYPADLQEPITGN